MQLFNVYTKKVYEKDGERKVKTYKTGVLKMTDRGTMYLRLFLFPDVDFYIREQEPLPIIDLEK